LLEGVAEGLLDLLHLVDPGALQVEDGSLHVLLGGRDLLAALPRIEDGLVDRQLGHERVELLPGGHDGRPQRVLALAHDLVADAQARIVEGPHRVQRGLRLDHPLARGQDHRVALVGQLQAPLQVDLGALEDLELGQ
jgi:hypothetical protein